MMKFDPLLPMLRRSFSDWNEDNAPRLGAALAFYTILSISPLVILVVAIASLVFDRSSAQALLLSQVQSLVGPEGKDAVESMLASGQKASSGIFATVIGAITLIFGASGIFGELRSALNTIWEAQPKTNSGMWGMVRERFFSFGMVMSVGFVLLVSLLASAGLAAMTKFFSGLLPIPPFVLGTFNFLVSFVGIAVLFAFIFEIRSGDQGEMERCQSGCRCYGFSFYPGQVTIRSLSRQREPRLRVWSGRITYRDGGLGLLLGPDLLFRCGVYPRLCTCEITRRHPRSRSFRTTVVHQEWLSHRARRDLDLVGEGSCAIPANQQTADI